MAGYIFSLGGSNLKTEQDIQRVLNNIIGSGVYSTDLNIPLKNLWQTHHEGTFADFLSMNEGDHVYFFIKRKIYGIGHLINIEGDCKHFNFPNADIPLCESFKDLKDQMILNKSSFNLGNRFLCTFEGAPCFFRNGVDMDDILVSNPAAFKMLRVFSRLSFIKVDDHEDKALFDMILKRNELVIHNPQFTYEISDGVHNRVKELSNNEYKVHTRNILKLASKGEVLKHEMALEASIIDLINKSVESIFGHWDYISHQVVASPFKPTEYIDKMDIFGYKFVPDYKTISKYLLMEIKVGAANIEVIHQTMKYVDWINQEYSLGDYSMIEAFIIASDFSKEVIETRDTFAKRNFIKGRRPPITEEWKGLRLVSYKYNSYTGKLEFIEV